MRQSIVDAVAAIGPCSISEVAQLLGKEADRLYYHMRLLNRAGLLVSASTKRISQRQEMRFDVAGRPMFLRYDPANNANRRAVNAVVASMLRAAARDFRRAFNDGSTLRGSGRDVWAGRVEAMLTGQDVRELNALLSRIEARMYQARGRASSKRRPHQITFVFTRTDR